MNFDENEIKRQLRETVLGFDPEVSKSSDSKEIDQLRLEITKLQKFCIILNERLRSLEEAGPSSLDPSLLQQQSPKTLKSPKVSNNVLPTSPTFDGNQVHKKRGRPRTTK